MQSHYLSIEADITKCDFDFELNDKSSALIGKHLRDKMETDTDVAAIIVVATIQHLQRNPKLSTWAISLLLNNASINTVK